MNVKPIFLFLISIVMLAACEPGNEKPGFGKYGMLDPNLPEYAASAFFDHIFHDDDINGAVDIASPSLARLLKSYHTNRNIQRHVLNLRFDKVEIRPHTGSAGRNEFGKEAKVIVFFEGELDGNILKDMRVVDLVRINKEWKVDKVSIE
jgi:hypothetical protein